MSDGVAGITALGDHRAPGGYREIVRSSALEAARGGSFSRVAEEA